MRPAALASRCVLAITVVLGLTACGDKEPPKSGKAPAPVKPAAKPSRARQPALPAKTPRQAALDFLQSLRDGDKDLFLASAHFEDKAILSAVFDGQTAMWAFATRFRAAYGDEVVKRYGMPPSLDDLEKRLTVSEERGSTIARLDDMRLALVRQADGTWKVDVSHLLPSDRSRVVPAARLMAAAANQAMARIGQPDHTPEQIMADLREAMTRASRTVEDKPRVETELGPMRRQPWRVPDVEMDLVYVEAGRFDRKRLQAGPGAKPEVAHRAPEQIRDGFWIGKHEVTQRQYGAVMKSNPSRFRGEKLPVECVSYHDALAFCQKLTERERRAYRLPSGYVYRLPTCAEWEYCCRAGRDEPAPADLAAEAWFKDNAEGRTHPVGLRKANPWGIYDMLGNVIEWCGDRLNPRMASYQGGSYEIEADRCAAGYLWGGSLGFKTPALGFRVVLAPENL